MGNTEGLTDYAESFDKTAQILCYVEGAAQSLNAISSGKSAYEAGAFAASGSWFFGVTAWAWAFAAMGATGAATSGVGAAEQFKCSLLCGEKRCENGTQSFSLSFQIRTAALCAVGSRR